MFLLLLIFVAILGLRWRAHQFGISAGFGIYAAVLPTGFHKILRNRIKIQLEMVSHLSCVVHCGGFNLAVVFQYPHRSRSSKQ